MEYLYRLVVFVDDKSEVLNVDIVPTSWISWREKDHSLVCKFMPDPYTEAKRKLLRKFVQVGKRPNETWPSYRVETRGGAKIYSEAEARLSVLKEQEYAFTEGNELDANKQFIADLQSLKTVPKSASTIRTALDFVAKDLRKKKQPNHKIARIISLSEESDNEDNKPATQKPSGNRVNSLPSCSKQVRKKNTNLKNTQYCDTNAELITDSLEGTFSMYQEPFASRSAADMDIENEGCVATLIKKVYWSLKTEMNILQKQLIHQETELNQIHQSLNVHLLPENRRPLICDAENESDEGSNDVRLPCSNLEEFEALEEKLLNDRKYHMKAKADLTRSINKNKSMTRNVGDIMRKFFTLDIAKRFTPVKKVQGKKVLKDTTFYNLLEDVILHTFKVGNTLPQKRVILKAVMSVLYNVKDWDGRRVSRRKPNNN